MAVALFTSACAGSNEDVTVKIYEKKQEEEVKPPIEAEEEATWAQYDESALMYRVDLDKFLTDKLKSPLKTLRNSDVINLIEIVREELGEDFYSEDKNGNKLCNLDGKSVYIGKYSGTGIYVEFYSSEDSLTENSLEYIIEVDKDGKTTSTSRSREEGSYKFSKYSVRYHGNKESTRGICLRENRSEYLSIDIHEGYGIFDSCSISFFTEMGYAYVNISKEDYAVLHEIMLSYSDSDNLYEFLIDNVDLLSKYVDLIKEENAEFYEDLCGLINKYIEKAKTLRYE